MLALCLSALFPTLCGAGGVFADKLAMRDGQGDLTADLIRQKAAHQAMYETFSANAIAVPVATFQSRLQVSRVGIFNRVAAGTLRVRGNAGETMMSHFYVSEGWSQVPGQTGNQGIDGLFVKRSSPKGDIVKFQVVDSKVGDSKLEHRDHGWQLSPEWTRYNLEKCLRAAEKEYGKNPSAELAKQIADYKHMIAMIDKGYVPPARVYHAEIKVNAQSGRTELVCENGRVDFAAGKPVIKSTGNPMRVDMQTPDALLSKPMLKARNKWYASIEENMTKVGIPKWVSKRISATLKQSIQDGSISSSKDANKFIRDKVVAYQKAVNYTVVAGASVAAGTVLGLSVVAHDWVVNGSVDSATWKRAGTSAAVGTVAAAGMTVAQAGLTKVVVRQIAKYQIKHSANRATQKLVALAAKKGVSNAVKKKLEKKILSETAKLFKEYGAKIGGGVAAVVGSAFGVYEVCSAVGKLQRGEISKQDSVVYGSIGGLNISGAVAVCFLGGPVAWAVGGFTFVVGGAYSIYHENRREKIIGERLDKEAEDLARFNAEWRRKKLEKYMNDLKVGAMDDEKLGWAAISKSL